MMDDNNKIRVGKGPLTELQLRMLEGAAQLIIPNDVERAMPGASELDLQNYLRESRQEQVQMVITCVDALTGYIADRENTDGHTLNERPETVTIAGFAENHPDLWQLLVLTIYSCYYQDERVLLALGMDARPPFPRGNEVKPGDFSLLDPVKQRDSFYRQVTETAGD